MNSDVHECDFLSLREDDEPGAFTAEVPQDCTERPSVYVPYAVAKATDRDLEDLSPLYAAIEPDALDALFARRPGGDERREGEVTFPYDGVTVTLTAKGIVRIRVPSPGNEDGSDP